MNSYNIKLVYDYGTAQEFKEMVTHTACLELFTRNIHTTQPSASVIVGQRKNLWVTVVG